MTKVRFVKPHVIDSVWTQPANADGTGGFVAEVSDAVLASLRASETAFEIVEEPVIKAEVKEEVKDETDYSVVVPRRKR